MPYNLVKVHKKSIKFKLTSNKINFIEKIVIKIYIMFNTRPKSPIKNIINTVFVTPYILFNIIYLIICVSSNQVHTLRFELRASGLKSYMLDLADLYTLTFMKINLQISNIAVSSTTTEFNLCCCSRLDLK